MSNVNNAYTCISNDFFYHHGNLTGLMSFDEYTYNKLKLNLWVNDLING
jgi:hypothetical protein